MSFYLLLLNSDNSTGTGFAKSLHLSRENRTDFHVIGTSTHAGRAHLTCNDYTVLVSKEINDDPLSTTKHVQDRLGIKASLVYQTKSAEPMLKLSAFRDILPTYLPPPELLKITEDKYATYAQLHAHGFPVPYTKLLKKPDDVHSAMKECRVPMYWVRASTGQGGAGSLSSADAAEIVGHVTEHDGWGRFIIAEKLPIDVARSWQERLSDHLYPGEMVTWIALYDEGRLIAAQSRKRLYFEHTKLSTTGVGYTGGVMSLRNDAITELSDAIVRCFGCNPHGPFGIDYVIGNDGEPKVTEVQAGRFHSTTYFLSLVGLNFPRLLLDVFRGGVLSPPKIDPVPPGVVWLQRFGSDDTLRYRDELLEFVNTGIFHNDETAIVHHQLGERILSAISTK